MKKLPWSVFLPAQFTCHGQEVARGQSVPATRLAAATNKTAALKEADSLNLEAVRLFQAAGYDEALPLARQVLNALAPPCSMASRLK